MTPAEALELLVLGLNRATLNPMERAGLQAAVEVLRTATKTEDPPKL